jgi:hypothetical protein
MAVSVIRKKSCQNLLFFDFLNFLFFIVFLRPLFLLPGALRAAPAGLLEIGPPRPAKAGAVRWAA